MVYINTRWHHGRHRTFLPIALGLLLQCGCHTGETTISDSELQDMATRYAAAWSSQNPEQLASFYTENGSLVVNDGEPSVGRDTIEATARSFMTAFPDMVVVLDSVIRVDDHHATFHWTWTGTNTGPGGTGRSVRISGFEEWTLGSEGLIQQSLGHYDQAEFERQVSDGSGRTSAVDPFGPLTATRL